MDNIKNIVHFYFINMIITKEIVLIITSYKLISLYKSKGYDIKRNLEINIKVNDLHKSCKEFIFAQCETCSSKKKVRYKAYLINKQNSINNIFQCKTCRTKTNLLEKEGISSIWERDSTKEKRKKTNFERYGSEHVFQSNKVKDKIKSTNLKKYGVKNPNKLTSIIEKRKQTNLEKYGVDNPAKNEIIKDKIKKTNLEKYGKEYYSQTNRWLEKTKYTNLEKYGVDNPAKNEIIKDKIKNTNLKIYGTEYPQQSDIFKTKQFEKYKIKILERYNDLNILSFDKNKVEFECPNCNKISFISIHLLHQRYKYSNNKLCLQCNPLNSLSSFSKGEHEVKDFIESLGITTKKDRTILNGDELDIFIPSHNLAIEFNGVYWHSELKKDEDYHINKTKGCNKKDIKLIHIYQDQWTLKKDIVKSRLKNELGLTEQKIYARKTKIKDVDSKVAAAFLSENHLQGKVNGPIRYGLYYNDELVSLMTFGKLRKSLGQTSKEGNYELLRFCNKLNISVIGGASKLFKHFIKEIKPKEVISYALIEWTNGTKPSLYDNLGFEEVGDTGLSWWWVIDGERKHRFNYRKDKLVSEGFDANKTAVEIMHERGYFRLFGAGNLTFKYEINF